MLIFRKLCVACLVLTGLLVRLTLAGDGVPFEQRLPDSAAIYVRIPDGVALQDRFWKSSWGQLAADESMSAVRQDTLRYWQNRLAQSGVLPGDLTLPELLAGSTGELAFAVLMPPGSRPVVALTAELKAARTIHERVLSQAVSAGATREDIVHQEVPIALLTASGRNGMKRQLAVFRREDRLVAASSLELARSIVDRWSGQPAGSLAKTAGFQQVFAAGVATEPNRQPGLTWFVQPEQILGSPSPAGPRAGLTQALVRGLSGLGGTLDMQAGRYDTILQVSAAVADDNALAGLFNLPASEQSLPAWVPDSVSSCAVLNWDSERAWLKLEQLADQTLGAGQFARSIETFAAAETGPMIHLKRDIVEQFSGQVAVLQGQGAASADGLASDSSATLLALGVKDAAAVQQVLERLTKAGAKSRQAGDARVYHLQRKAGSELHLAVGHGALLLSDDAALIECSLTVDIKTARLVDAREWKTLAPLMPRRTSLIGVQHSAEQLRSALELLRRLPAGQGGVDFSRLPPFEKIQPHLRPTGSWAAPTPHGFQYVSFTLKDAAASRPSE